MGGKEISFSPTIDGRRDWVDRDAMRLTARVNPTIHGPRMPHVSGV